MSSNSPLPDDLRRALHEEPDAADLEQVWRLLGDVPPAAPAADTNADWRAVQQQLHSQRAPDRRARRLDRSSRSRWPVAAFASAAITAVCLGLALWALQPVQHQAPLGETAEVVLPDGSRVVLNSGAALARSRFFSSSREVSLTGEAYFDVVTGTVPFVVETHNARVEVLGTSFNVRAWDGQTTVALVEGRVALSGENGRAEALVPGDTYRLSPGGSAPEAVEADVNQMSAWRTGSLAFQGMPLLSVLQEVERRYAVSFTPEAGTPLRANVSAFYQQRPPLDVLLGDLGAAAGVRFAPSADGYTIRALVRPSSSSSHALPRTAP